MLNWVTLPQFEPFNGQYCWVRTVASFFNPFLAIWNSTLESFIADVTGLVYSKELIARWREVDDEPGKTIILSSNQSPLNPLRIDLAGQENFFFIINWGDGKFNSGYFSDAVVSYVHSYSSTGTYTVTISTPSASITYIRINNEPVTFTIPDLLENHYLRYLQLSQVNMSGIMYASLPFPLLTELVIRQTLITGTFPPVNTCPLLADITCRNTSLSGNLPDFSLLPNLNRIEMDDCLFTGSVPDYSGCSLLTVIRLAGNLLSGSIPSMFNLAVLDNFYIAGCGLSGTIPSLSNCLVLRVFDISGNAFSVYTSSVIALTCVSFLALSNSFADTEVNKVLANFALNISSRPTVGTINLSGTGMAAPTGQGIIDAAAIRARGWTVTTN